MFIHFSESSGYNLRSVNINTVNMSKNKCTKKLNNMVPLVHAC